MKEKYYEIIKTKNAAELNKDLKDKRDRLWSLKNDLAAGKVKNVQEIRQIKRDIARILTLLNAKT